MCKSGKVVANFLGYKMSLRITMNDRSCVSCKEDDDVRVLSSNCAALFVRTLIKTLKTLADSGWMPSLRRSLDMPEAQFPCRRSSKIQYLV